MMQQQSPAAPSSLKWPVYRQLAGLTLAACLQSSLLLLWPLIVLESDLNQASQFAVQLGSCWLLAGPLLLCLPAWLAAGRLGPRWSLWLAGCFVAACLSCPFLVGGTGAWLAALGLGAGCLGLSITCLPSGAAAPVFLLPWLSSWQRPRRQQLLLLSVCACGAGASIGAVLAPPIFRLLSDWLSWRGACLATAGWLLNWLVAGALMSPPPSPSPAQLQRQQWTESAGADLPISVAIPDPNFYYCLHYCEDVGLLPGSNNSGYGCYGNGDSDGDAATRTAAKRKQKSCDSGLGDSMNLSAGATNSRGAVRNVSSAPPSGAPVELVAESGRCEPEMSDWHTDPQQHQHQLEAEACPEVLDPGAAAEEAAAEDDDLLFSSNRNLARLSVNHCGASSDEIFVVDDEESGVAAIRDEKIVGDLDDDGNDDDKDRLLQQPPGTPPPVALSGSAAGGAGVVVRFELLRDADEAGSSKESASCFADFPTNIGQVSELSSASADSYRIFLQREPASLPTIPEHSELDMELVYNEHTADVEGGQGIEELMDRPLDDQMYGGHLDLSQSECLEDSASSLLLLQQPLGSDLQLQQQQQQQHQQQQSKSRSRSLARSSCGVEDDRSIGSLSIGSLQRQASSGFSDSSVDRLLSGTKRRARSMESLRASTLAAPTSANAVQNVDVNAEGDALSPGSGLAASTAATSTSPTILLTRDQLADLVLTKSDPELFLTVSRTNRLVDDEAKVVDEDRRVDAVAEEEADDREEQEREPLVTSFQSAPSSRNVEAAAADNINASPMSRLLRQPAYLLSCLSYALQFASLINCLIYLGPLLAWQRRLIRYDCALAAVGLGLLPGGTVAPAALYSSVAMVGPGREHGDRQGGSKSVQIGKAAASAVGILGSAVLAASSAWLSRSGLDDEASGTGSLGAAFHGAAFAASGIGFSLGLFTTAGPAALIHCCGWDAWIRLLQRPKAASNVAGLYAELWRLALSSVLWCWTMAGLACLVLGTASAIWLRSFETSLATNPARLLSLFWINCVIACVALGLALASAALLHWRCCFRLLQSQLVPTATKSTPSSVDGSLASKAMDKDREQDAVLEEITAL